MKSIFTSLILLVSLSLTISAQSPVLNLLGQLNPHASAGYNDCWGYTAPDGREYALLGVVNGTSIVDITDTNNLVEITFIPGPSSTWKDIKTYGQYAYVVNESSGGMQIIDLSNLPTSATLAATYTGFQTSHNLYLDESTGILYVEGSGAEGVRIFSLANPLQPVQISSAGSGLHDIFTRDGMMFLSEGSAGSFGIYDVTDPALPVFLERIIVPAGGYAHNAWSNEDNTLLMTTEETTGKTIKLWDISDLSNITLTDEVLASDALAHNAHIKGHYAYVSHYGNGLVVYDIADPYNVVEVGHYDTFPGGGGGFVGAWGAFPFFRTGKVIISDQSFGLFVVYFQGAADGDLLDPLAPSDFDIYSDYTTPDAMILTWQDPSSLVNGNAISSGEISIDVRRDGALIASVNGGLQTYTDGGLIDGQSYSYEISTRITANDSTSRAVSRDWVAGGAKQPTAPLDLAAANRGQQLLIQWTNPATNVDNTPLDDLAEIRVYENGSLIKTVSRSTSAAGMNDSTLISSPANNAIYHLTAVDNEAPQNESPASSTTSGPLKAPFTDTWNEISLSEAFWPVALRAGNPRTESFPGPFAMPSGPYVLRIEGGATLTSNAIDLGNQPQIFELRMWESEQDLELGESAFLEFQDANGNWQILHQFVGTDNGYLVYEPFEEVAYDLPAAAYHSQFRFRYRAGDLMSGTDQWYFDDVQLAPISGAPLLSINPLNYSDTLDIGQTRDFDFTIANEAIQTATLNYNVTIESGSDWISLGSSAGAINSGATEDVTVTLNSSNLAVGDHVGTIKITSDANAPGGQQSKTLTVNLSVNSVTGIGDENLPTVFALEQNYPNPFNPETVIRYQLPQTEDVKISVYNLLGQTVRTLVNGQINAGYHTTRWDGRNQRGEQVTSGMYLYRIEAGSFTSVRKMILLK